MLIGLTLFAVVGALYAFVTFQVALSLIRFWVA